MKKLLLALCLVVTMCFLNACKEVDPGDDNATGDPPPNTAEGSSVTLTVFNKDIDLQDQNILVYIRPDDFFGGSLVSAWQKCDPPIGGSSKLDDLNDTVSVAAIYDNDAWMTATKTIPLQHTATVSGSGQSVVLENPVFDFMLPPDLRGFQNSTSHIDVYPVWSLNGHTVCKPEYPLFPNSRTTFRGFQSKVYLTIGSMAQTDTFIDIYWDQLHEIDIPSNLQSADIEVSLDPSTNMPVYTLKNEVYQD